MSSSDEQRTQGASDDPPPAREEEGANAAHLSPQPWPWLGPRVLIEHADGDRADALAVSLRRAGYAVAICPGPAPDDRCPLADDENCAAAEGADLVVSGLGLELAGTRDALAALRTRLPRTPLIVEAPLQHAARWYRLVEGCELVEPPASPDHVVERVRALLEGKGSSVA